MRDELIDVLFEGGILIAWGLLAMIAGAAFALPWWTAVLLMLAGHVATMCWCFHLDAGRQ